MISTTAQRLVALAESAGDAIMSVYRRADFGTELKADDSPLTQADTAAQAVIERELVAFTLPVLSEERATLPFATRRRWSRYFLVDPLDGTKEFIARNDEFTVNIALIERHDAVLGVVYAPALDLCYVGERGVGSFRRRADRQWQAIAAAAWPPTRTRPLRVVASRRHGIPQLERLLGDIPHTVERRGSALKICMVAEGSADWYPRFGPTSEWDTAAGQCVLECAGGALTDEQLERLRYNCKDSLLNPDFFAWGAHADRWWHQLHQK